MGDSFNTPAVDSISYPDITLRVGPLHLPPDCRAGRTGLDTPLQVVILGRRRAPPHAERVFPEVSSQCVDLRPDERSLFRAR